MSAGDDDRGWTPAASFDGGSLDCGGGLLLLIRQHIDPLEEGELLEIVSAEPSVREDLPAWCRMTGNELVATRALDGASRFLVSKGRFAGRPVAPAAGAAAPSARRVEPRLAPVHVPSTLPAPAPAPEIPPLSVMGVGSWPRPRWMLDALHARLEGRLGEREFEETADDAVRLALQGQLAAGVDVVSDGEQRRDSYASFVGARLDNCQLVPIADLLAYVSDPAELERELRALDVPAAVRHPAVLGPLSRSRPLAVHELEFVRRETSLPVKVALPGPYLLTRTMWMECVSDRTYADREALARDVVRVLREELHFLLAGGAAIVQLDEPVLSEVVHGGRVAGNRTFMCGMLDARGDVEGELAFAESLLAAVAAGLPRERLALHVCRGNWTPDEAVALAGDYRPLLPLLSRAPVGTLFLELATPRAGELEVLRALPDDRRIGVGVVNQKSPRIETPEEVLARAERAVRLFGVERVLLNPDCGFATFADNPIASSAVATGKLAAIAAAARILRERHGR